MLTAYIQADTLKMATDFVANFCTDTDTDGLYNGHKITLAPCASGVLIVIEITDTDDDREVAEGIDCAAEFYGLDVRLITVGSDEA